jgi:hypothetical protein
VLSTPPGGDAICSLSTPLAQTCRSAAMTTTEKGLDIAGVLQIREILHGLFARLSVRDVQVVSLEGRGLVEWHQADLDLAATLLVAFEKMGPA